MNTELRTWAEAQWGACVLGNSQRTRRAVKVGMQIAERPGAGLPEQMGSQAMLKGAYRLLNCRAVDIESLWQPHQTATRQAARSGEYKTVLFIQDWTTLDYSHHRSKRGIGPVGSCHQYPHQRQRGMLLHSVLAYGLEAKQILGLAHGQVIVRAEGAEAQVEAAAATQSGAKKCKSKSSDNGGRRGDGIEGRAWERAAEAIGSAPDNSLSRWIHVSDRESDVFEYMAMCKRLNKDFVIRAFRDRKVQGDPAALAAQEQDQDQDHSDQCSFYLMKLARMLVSQDAEQTYLVEVPATAKKGVKQPKRIAQIRLAWTPIYMPAPSYLKDQPEMVGQDVWIVRAWEPHPPPGVEAVEWILITSLAVADWDAARYITRIYECRWLIEDYHMCLKTGCRIEDSQLDEGDDLQRLLGFNALIAVRLMQLRQMVRTAPQTLVGTAGKVSTASTFINPLMLQLLAAKFNLAVNTLTVSQFWAHVARLGGHLGRKSDGPPGWRTIWKGWHHLSDWADGVRLLSLEKSG